MSQFPFIMGIVNVTPDSFSDGGLYADHQTAIAHANSLIEQGADIIDIGGESTRPGAEIISIEEEIHRTIPVIEGIRKFNSDITISIDTTKSEVAEAAMNAGACMINDISGLDSGPELARIAAHFDVPLILMHRKGVSATMQQNPQYANIVEEVKLHLMERCALAKEYGAHKLIIDIGIGFGKTMDHNWELLRSLHEFYDIGYPMLLGISRKSFIGSTLDITNPADRDVPTHLLHALLMNKHCSIIRVHDVSMAVMAKKLYARLHE
ncbi:MAG: dihydropteroate synthase [Ignavibacteria bacterium]|nr:dihydropteroate synthase [Ignavibacteria bacterium]